MTWYFNENYRGSASDHLCLLCKSHKRASVTIDHDRSRLRNVLGQLGIYSLFSYENLKFSTKKIKERILNGQQEILVNFQSYANVFDTSAIERAHGFALFSICWWMKIRDIPASLRQSVTSLVYKLCTDTPFLARLTPTFWAFILREDRA